MSTSTETLSRQQWADLSALFEQLVELPDAAVDARIADSALPQEAQQVLRRMLVAHRGRSILDETIDRLAERLLELGPAGASLMPENLLGRSFGAWELVRELARGGMGAVFEARRADGQFEKTVALKVIKPGAYSDHTARRFVEEMQTLARLEHPGIARLVDGGISEEGFPYFAMEYVDGMPITKYADAHRLDIGARVELLIQVCTAVEHAHRNLIVHGDLKPSNLLVNASGETRLLDFGIAQSLQQSEDVPLLPRFTPGYAAPEQARGLPLTTSCDVFGLSAVLFELCCGSAPGAGQQADAVDGDPHAAQLAQISARQRLESTPERRELARRRASSERSLRQTLAGDLGWILQHGLAFDPADRMANVAELRAELRRWQRGMALDSHPPRFGYRFRRWLGRHRLPVAISLAVLLGFALAGASVVRQTQLANSASARAQWSKEFLLSVFEHADPVLNQQRPITVNALTGQAAQELLDAQNSMAPELQLEAATVLGTVQSNLGQFESALALSALRLQLAERSGDQQLLAQALLAHGDALTALDQLRSAIEQLRRATQLAPLQDGVYLTSVAAVQQLATLLARVSEFDEAQRLVGALMAHEEEIATLAGGARALSLVYSTRGLIERERGESEQALVSIQHSLDFARQVGEQSQTYVDALTGLAALHYSRGDARATSEVDRQVLAHFERIYGADHPLTLKAQSELAVSLSQLGEMEQALQLNQRVLAGYRRSLGEDNQYVAGTLANVGAAQRALGRFELGLDHYRQSLQIWRRLESAPPTSLAAVLLGQGRVLIEMQRYAEAQAAFEEALALIEQTLGADHVLYLRGQTYYAPVLIETGRLEEAAALMGPAYRRLVDDYGESSTRASVAAVTLAQLQLRQGQTEAAGALAKQALQALDLAGVRERHAIEVRKARHVLETALSGD